MFRERNSSCSFWSIVLKLHRWLSHGLKMCILFAHKSQIHFSRVRSPWFMPKIGFRSISCERIDGLGSYFACILLLTIPSLGLSHDIFHQFSTELRGWSGGAKVLCILDHRGVQLILAYSWARPAILVVGKGRGGMFLFLLFLHFHSCSSFFPVPLFHLLYSLFYLFSPFLWETTQNDPQGLTCR